MQPKYLMNLSADSSKDLASELVHYAFINEVAIKASLCLFFNKLWVPAFLSLIFLIFWTSHVGGQREGSGVPRGRHLPSPGPRAGFRDHSVRRRSREGPGVGAVTAASGGTADGILRPGTEGADERRDKYGKHGGPRPPGNHPSGKRGDGRNRSHLSLGGGGGGAEGPRMCSATPRSKAVEVWHFLSKRAITP